jgi:hypothetical protein
MSTIEKFIQIDDAEIEASLPQAYTAVSLKVRKNKRPGWLLHIVRQPLVHFLVAGLALFAAASLLDRDKTRSIRDIQVSAAEIQRLEDVWSRQYGRTPTRAELQNLIDDYVREEIYYREAISSGLDKDDSIIRRRLVEKMEFLSQEVASGEPSDKELDDYFQRHRDKFLLPPQIAFTHIFFSPSKRGPALQSDARKSLTLLRGSTNTDLSKLGDAFMLQNEYPLQTPQEIASLFGRDFSDELFKLQPGEWRGPLRSSYGLHLVRITRYEPAHPPQLNEVRTQVVTDFKNERLQTAAENYYARLRQKYRIEINSAAMASALANADSNASTKRRVETNAPDVD